MGKYLVYADTKKRLSLLIPPTHDSMLGNQDRKINSFLYSQNICFLILIFCCICLMVPEVGLEPTTFRVWTGCSRQLSYSGIRWLGRSNHKLPCSIFCLWVSYLYWTFGLSGTLVFHLMRWVSAFTNYALRPAMVLACGLEPLPQQPQCCVLPLH